MSVGNKPLFTEEEFSPRGSKPSRGGGGRGGGGGPDTGALIKGGVAAVLLLTGGVLIANHFGMLPRFGGEKMDPQQQAELERLYEEQQAEDERRREMLGEDEIWEGSS